MSISILFARGLIGEVIRRGFDPKPLLERSDLGEARLRDLRETLSHDEVRRLVEQTVALTGDPGVGLAAGARAPEHTVQLLGHLILAQATIRDAFATVTRYGSLLSDGASWSLIERGDSALLACTSSVPDSDLSRLLMDYTFAFAMNIGRHFFPPGERLRAVHFRHKPPSYADDYPAIFHCPVYFGQEHNATVFARALLDREKLHADPAVDKLLRESADQLLRERALARSMADSVRAILQSEHDLTTVDMRRIARTLRVSVHTLRRRLNAESTSFVKLLDDARCQFAQEQMQRTDTTIQQAAERLGFSETSAFFRAFKRWTGQTPSEYRRGACPALATGTDLHDH